MPICWCSNGKVGNTDLIYILFFSLAGGTAIYCMKGIDCTQDTGNDPDKNREGVKTDRTQEFNFSIYEEIVLPNGEVNIKSKHLQF